MSLNVERIKNQVKKAIAIMPATINLKRVSKTDDSMGGYIENIIDVATFDGFIDDSNHSIYLDRMNEAGTVKRTRSIGLLAVCEGFEIKNDDYFESDGVKYKVTYPGRIVEGIYNADLEIIS